jgi:phosphatidylserine/phosphatidylglycerophosphate/cardiolipin synthase-like enzyme
VLSQNGQPKAVWTGSTNLSENGIFGHSNLGHIVEDATVATAFRSYWDRLEADPGVNNTYRTANEAATPTPALPLADGTQVVFSPRGTNLETLDRYAQIAGSAQGALFMTFAFGMHAKFKEVYRRDDAILRMALLEKEGNPATEQEKADLLAIRRRPNVLVALGNRIVTNTFDRWLRELSRIVPSVHVYWIHTKYMLVDPLGADPVVVTGSANFSKASTESNDENMLVVKGDKRIADVYFGEFLRLYAHYAFRESVKRYLDQAEDGVVEEWRPQYLAWMEPYFDPADHKALFARRVYFGGPMAE